MSATAESVKSKITREFDLKVTEKREKELFKEMTGLTREIAGFEDDKKKAVAEFNGKIEERRDRLTKIAEIDAAGTETVTLEADMVKDFSAATKRYFVDGKQIHEEAMTAQELQMDFGDIPKKKPAKTARDGRLEDAQKAIASKKKGKAVTLEIVKAETNRKTKRASTDGVYK